MMIKDAFNEGVQSFHDGSGFSSCIYPPETLLEFAFIKGYQYAKNNTLLESCQDEMYESADDFFLNYGWIEITEAKGIYQGREVTLNKPTKGDSKRAKVYVNSGNKVEHNGKQRIRAKKVEFGSKPGDKLRVRTSAKARKNFAARHNCADAKDKTTARYWSCRSGSKSGYW